MKIAVGSDHAGFELKSSLVRLLEEAGHTVEDVGPESAESTDYPIYADRAGQLVASGKCERGVLVCGSGAGVAIAANKVGGIRAVHAHDRSEAELSRRHNNANVVTLAGRRINASQAKEIVDAFVAAEFEAGRHKRRVDQIARMEATKT